MIQSTILFSKLNSNYICSYKSGLKTGHVQLQIKLFVQRDNQPNHQPHHLENRAHRHLERLQDDCMSSYKNTTWTDLRHYDAT